MRQTINVFRSLIRSGSCLVVLASAASLGAAADDGRLAEAVRKSDSAAVGALLRSDADVNAAEVDGMTPLHWASQLDDRDTAGMLIHAGANVKAATRYGVTPLTLASTNGSAGLIELLLKAGADPDTSLPKGETALMIAARTGAPTAVRMLLAHGANANAREGSKGQTALMWAAGEGHVAVMQMLIEAGAEVDARSKGGLTPLLFAARDGQIEALRLLLSARANPNDAVDPAATPAARAARGGTYIGTDGSSALALAIINRRYGAALLLLEKGANPNVPDSRGSLLHALAWVRRPGADIQTGFVLPDATDAESLEVASSLLSHGANPNVRIAWQEAPYDTDGAVRMPANIVMGRHFLSLVGATPFYLAAKHGDVALMRVLVGNGADPVMPTAQKITPLMAAAGLGFWDGESPGPTTGVPERETLDAVKLCVALGNDVNAVTDFGDAPLVGDGASLLQSVPLHITKDPRQELGDMRWGGSTALHGAAYRGLDPVVQFLVDKGARVDAKNALGWTPLTVAEGLFAANNYHEANPSTVALLKALMAPRGSTGR